ncbi:hypothetical protein F5B21DRAFT_524040 [Xylaria acuta]|nr:hypothetical protein F5B21DRAFT_524040 [Xylaria acuta]
MFLNPAFPYETGNPLSLPPYASPVHPNPPNLQSLPSAPAEEEKSAWAKDKRRLGGRFDPPRPRYDWGEQVPPSAVPVPYSEPQPYDWGEEQVALPTMQTPYRKRRPAVVDMQSLAMWIGGHAVDYHESFKVTDLAGRVRHNMDDFIGALASYRAKREMAKREKWGPRWNNEMEDLYHRALNIQVLYESTVARYHGPFKPKTSCSDIEKDEALQLLKAMFDYDYDVWDGFIWHMVHWISHFHKICGWD